MPLHFRSLSAKEAADMAEAAVFHASAKMGQQTGYFVAVGSKNPRLVLCARAFGDVREAGQTIALAKVRTALAMGRDSLAQGKKMVDEGLDPFDYAGAVETRFGGGCLLYDSDGYLVGAAAWSGCEEVGDDVEIIRVAALTQGFVLKVFD